MTETKWKIGDPLTDEMRAKRRATLAAGGRKKKGARSGGTPVAARPRERDAAPRRPVAGVPVAIVVRIEGLVGQAIGVLEGGVLWGMRRAVSDEMRETTVASKIAGGPPELVLEPTGRKFRTFSDEIIEADKLEEWERDMLAEALTAEMLRYPRLKAFLIRMTEIQERTSLPTVIALIALPRLVNHGKMPPEFADFIAAARDAARKARAKGARTRAQRATAAEAPTPAPIEPAPASANGSSGPAEVPSADELEHELSRVSPTTA